MNPKFIRLALALVLLTAGHALAGPRKKKPKTPPTPAPAPEPAPAPAPTPDVAPAPPPVDQSVELRAQMETLQKQVEQQRIELAALQEAQKKAPASPVEPRLEKLLKGFYGTLDVSFDDTSKGIDGLVAYPYALNDPNDPSSGFVVAGGPKGGPVGRLTWMPALSTNLSKIGYRGAHSIDESAIDLIYQIEAGIAITSAPGLNTSYTQQSDVTKSGIGYGDSFVGLGSKGWGALKLGTTYAPYKKAVDRLNPFSGMLGDMHVVMGNTGGDNRVEFGTRLEHSVWYESPMIGDALGFDVLFSPGQNRTYDNVVQSAGSPDCNGGNIPGSGNLLLNCDDGGFDDAFSADIHIQIAGLYSTAAFEWHHNVNRNSDGIGSNNPIYGYYAANPNAPNNPLDFNTFNAIVAEYPGYAAVASPPYLNDIGNEYAAQAGLQYSLPFGLTVNGIYEMLRRDVPSVLQFQNERSRNGWWLAVTQTITSHGLLMAGWAHARSTPGDPGGQHNYDPLTPDNKADMYTVAFKWALDKWVYWYIDAAETVNHNNAHYDLGAGGRGLTTDCHDGTNTILVDYSSAGPTTWGGCHIEGASTGVGLKF